MAAALWGPYGPSYQAMAEGCAEWDAMILAAKTAQLHDLPLVLAVHMSADHTEILSIG